LQALLLHVEDRDYQVPGRLTVEGRSYEVKLRFRGRSTRFLDKKSWQVRLEDERFEGRKRLELLAEWKDAGYLTEKLWYDVAAGLGLEVPRTRYVHLTVNGVYEGVFTELESLDKAFLKSHGFDEDGDIYRCGMHDCQMSRPPRPYVEPWPASESYMERWEKQTNEKQPWDRLRFFLEDVNRTPPHAFADFVEQHLELEDYLTWMALDAFIANDVQGDSRSYLLYDRETARWTYVPWDLNNALSLYNRTNPVQQRVKAHHPLFSYTAYDPSVYALFEFRRDVLEYADMKPTWSTLSTRILDDPELRARFAERLRLLLDHLTEEELGPRIDAMHALLAPFILPGPDGTTRDRYVSAPHAAESARQLRRFVRERRQWLLSQLDTIESLGSGPLVIDRVGRDASGGFWVQLYNRGTTPVSLEGLSLSGFTRIPDQWPLPALTVQPGQVLTFREAGTGALRLGARIDPQRLEFSLYEVPASRDAHDQMKALDLWWLHPLAPGEAYGRQPRGAERFGRQPGP
jgi:spore coat protein H